MKNIRYGKESVLGLSKLGLCMSHRAGAVVEGLAVQWASGRKKTVWDWRRFFEDREL